jgi:ATP-dependent DNA helicase PIF1
LNTGIKQPINKLQLFEGFSFKTINHRLFMYDTKHTTSFLTVLLYDFTHVGESRDYYSCDSIDRSDVNDCEIFETLTPEFLNSLRTSGLPNHKITLKVGTPIMLMRNLEQADGLCNGSRLIVTKLGDHVIEAKMMSGKNIGTKVGIPRLALSPSQSPWPFKLRRLQFPIIVSYAMTINKSQGQSLDYVGLYLPKEAFNYGQLYVAMSRVTTKEGLKVLIHDKEKKEANIVTTTTTNVVFKEVDNFLNSI